MLNIDWNSFNDATDVNTKWSIMLEHITTYLDQMCLIKNITFKDRNKPWLNKDILELIYERNQVMYEYCSNKVYNKPLLS